MRCKLAWVSCCLVLCAARPAAAEAPADRGAEASAAAHAQRGRAARDAKQWSEAEAAYEAALGVADTGAMPAGQRAEVLGELGLVELARGKHRDAAEHLWESLSLSEQLGVRAARRFEQGTLQAQAHVVRLYIGVNPPDAEVLLDGQPLKRQGSTYLVFVEPGRHTVRARLSGYGEVSDDLDAAKGEARRVALRLPEKQAPAPKKEVAPAPAPAGTQASPTGDKVRVAGLVVSAAAVSLGTTALVWAAVLHGDNRDRVAELRRAGWPPDACLASDPPAECAELADTVDQRDRLATLGLVTLAGGIAAGVVTLGSFWVAYGPRSAKEKEKVHVAPMATADRAGLVVHGSW